jgi:hydroxymethylglutaryl-CoA reductase
MKEKLINGFSKLSKKEKIEWLLATFSENPEKALEQIKGFWHPDADLQKVLDGFSENTITNFPMPFGIAPNFLINGEPYAVPMVIEESSVVAAASSAAKFWQTRGGIRTRVLSSKKVGQVHFLWRGEGSKLRSHLPQIREELQQRAAPLTANMEKRGGGVLDVDLLDLTAEEPDYFQLRVTFETCDSMGANFINSVLESFARSLSGWISRQEQFPEKERRIEVIMAILSNYTPECIVRAEVECSLDLLQNACQDIDGDTFARKFRLAVRAAEVDPYRATTHNKGIYNGVDAVVLATGNDFRAVEAAGHAYAARDGQYRSLSHCEVTENTFRFWLKLPLALGTVGGLTHLHPLANLSLDILGKPSAPRLMEIVAATGLAQNFAALRSLTTTGIQKGHMKMHLQNILNHLGATESQKQEAAVFFQDRTVSFQAVRDFILSGNTRTA